MNHLHLQAKADMSCPLCFVWVAFQHTKQLQSVSPANEPTRDEAEHSMLCAGFWTHINRNGELCKSHQSALENLDRVMHAAKTSSLILPGDS